MIVYRYVCAYIYIYMYELICMHKYREIFEHTVIIQGFVLIACLNCYREYFKIGGIWSSLLADPQINQGNMCSYNHVPGKFLFIKKGRASSIEFSWR